MATEADLAWWLAKAETLDWTWAKTYAKTAPHWYVLRGKTPGLTQDDLDRAMQVILSFGVPQKFYNYVAIYLVDPASGWKWFLPGNPSEPGYVPDLINRAALENFYGVQDLPDTTSRHRSVYDIAALGYDAMWTKPEDLEENRQVAALVARHIGAVAPTILDVGCGTGLTLDLGLTHPSLYTGLDPSQGMLNMLVLKHPQVRDLYPMTAAEFVDEVQPQPRSYDLVLGLFAGPSYMTPDEIVRVVELARRMVILMNYDGKWFPPYYDAEPPTASAARAVCRELSKRRGGKILTIGNFETLVIRH